MLLSRETSTDVKEEAAENSAKGYHQSTARAGGGKPRQIVDVKKRVSKKRNRQIMFNVFRAQV